jgi:hypothetical protein
MITMPSSLRHWIRSPPCWILTGVVIHPQIDSVIAWMTEMYGPVNHRWVIDFDDPGPSGWWIGFLHEEALMMFMLRWGHIIGTNNRNI